MAKYVKLKKFIKIFAIICLTFVLGGIAIGTGTYLIVTANTNLDTTKLETKQSGITILDNEDNPINFSFGTTDDTPIPNHTLNAFIAKEDKRFFKHHGIDIIRIAGALKTNLTKGDTVEGGSTITQQLIKNTHLSQEKTIKRKLKEIKLSKELEQTYSKDEILDTYLNSIYFGNNIFGIKGASSYYFNKQVKDLSIAESAILAGLISAPSVYNPVANIELSKQKAKIVLNLMEEQEYISQEEKQKALTELDFLSVTPKSEIGGLYLSFVSEEATKLLNLDTLPSSKNIIIKTYMNSALQKAMEERLQSQEYKAKDLGSTMPGIASIVLDNNTGGIIGFVGESRYNLMELKRQPASTIKPLLVYGPAIENNLISPSSFILDEPININGYTPHNATNNYYGWTTVRDNIVRSTNIPAVKILHETGIETSKNFASRLGINFDPEDNNLALALGGFNSGVTVKDLATAYMAIARGGSFTSSTFIKEIIIDNKTCYKHNPIGVQVMKNSTAYLLTDMLKSVAEYGTGRNIKGLNLKVASKTGTNAINGINHDGWNVSYTTEHTALCWTGNLNAVSETSSVQYNGSLYPTYFVKDIFAELYKNYTPKDFIMPNTVTQVKLDKDYYDKHLLYMTDDANNFITEVFALDNLPPYIDPIIKSIDLHKELGLNSSNSQEVIDYTKFIHKYGIW